MSEYYKPSIEELHVEQEYEFRNKGTYPNWIALKGRTHEDYYLTLINYFNNEYRIKYLDEQDVLDLGWEKIRDNYYSKPPFDLNLHSTKGLITLGNQEWEPICLYIKSKYDLQRQMKFLGIPLPKNTIYD